MYCFNDFGPPKILRYKLQISRAMLFFFLLECYKKQSIHISFIMINCCKAPAVGSVNKTGSFWMPLELVLRIPYAKHIFSLKKAKIKGY